MPVDVLSVSDEIRARLEALDAIPLERLTNAYTAGFQRVEPQINGLVEWLEAHPDATRQQVERAAAYKNLMAAITEELDDYQAIIRSEVRQAAPASAAEGLAGGALLLAASMAQYVGVETNELPDDALVNISPDALDFLTDYLDPAGPLFAKIDGISGYHAEQISAGIIEQVAQGKNPRVIADWIVNAYGVPLSDALRITRTVQLYSYRQAENAQYTANSDVLEGVQWSAKLDGFTCMSCIALHGKIFPVGTIADDHHNGRCAMIPVVKGAGKIIEKDGQAWFEEQPEAAQRSMMGPGKFEAWKAGKFDLNALTVSHQDDVFGEMKSEASLKDLIRNK